MDRHLGLRTKCNARWIYNN
ncbi:hypothetical protein CGLO_17990 [Colletotrichum gloeosporioides Cg-14]|uniref:Uncharacterized protein n=1 Tax=Colletotrichum gloeosporioides (strain Cg-14) TaxID=1237896 RepID=T0KVK1_COLGC|nr:hypothetical protein CGLO_17990 [Colletotrichum gloeosporioides Cg-14]